MVTVANANTDNPQVLTLAAWVYPDTLPNQVMRFVSLGGEKAVLAMMARRRVDRAAYTST